jgi:hypothetical protein
LTGSGTATADRIADFDAAEDLIDPRVHGDATPERVITLQGEVALTQVSFLL